MEPTTWVDPEDVCYPNGGMLRRGRAMLRANEHNPIVLPYGTVRAVGVQEASDVRIA
jgi:hypothetical protein